MHLYLNGIYVGKEKNKEKMKNQGKNTYVVDFWFKKKAKYSTIMQSSYPPYRCLGTDEKSKKKK